MHPKRFQMKKIIFILSLVILGIAAHAQTEKVAVQTKIYCSHCDECGDCKPNITKHISALKGIEKVEMDTKKMTITVTYDTKQTNPAAIRTAISKSGYDADDVKADPTAYTALDGCCKKK